MCRPLGTSHPNSWLLASLPLLLRLRRLHQNPPRRNVYASRDKCHRHAPTVHHLMIVGSRVSGKGVGSKLIKVGIDRSTALSLPYYLESSNPKNVLFYKWWGQTIILSLFVHSFTPPCSNNLQSPLQPCCAQAKLPRRPDHLPLLDGREGEEQGGGGDFDAASI